MSFFADGKLTPAWHHVACLFEMFIKQRATTKRIEDPEEDVKGWERLSDEDKQLVLDRLKELEKSCNYPNAREHSSVLDYRSVALGARNSERDLVAFIAAQESINFR